MAVKSLGEPYHAESRRFNLRGLWRLTAWAGVAALSLASVVLSANSGPGPQQRLATILALVSDQPDNSEAANGELGSTEPTQSPRSADPESEARRLAAVVQALAADRDRMLARINTLERNLNEPATGSVNRDGTAERRKSEAPNRDPESTSRDGAPLIPASPGASSELPPADTEAVTTPRSALPSAPAPPISVSSPASPLASPAAPVTGSAAAPTMLAVSVPVAAPPRSPPAAINPSAIPPGPSAGLPSGWLAVASAMPARQFTAATVPPADPAASLAFASANPAAENPAAVEPVTTRTEVGVDIGGAATVEALRALWTSAKTRAAPLLDKLRPVVVTREVRPGSVQLRLVLGPLANAGAAARLCASLAPIGRACRPTVFEGQHLAQLPTQ
jgi:hypothetical protein